jgi:hypothetical protein
MRRQITYRVKIIAKFGSLACDTWQNLKLNDVSSLSKLNELRAKNIIVFTEEQIDLFFRNFGISAKEKGRDLLSINSTACAHFFFRIKKVNEFYQLNIHDKYFFLNLARLFNQDYINDNYKDFHPWTLKEPVGGLLEQQFLAKRLDLMRGINVKDLVLFTKLDACAIYLYEWLHLTLEKSEDMGLHIPQIVIEKRLEEQRLKPTFIANMEESDELMDLEIDDLIKLFKIAKIFYASISTDYFSFIKKSYFPEFWIKEFLLSLISDKS